MVLLSPLCPFLFFPFLFVLLLLYKANVFGLLLSEYPDISLLSVIKYVTSACSV